MKTALEIYRTAKDEIISQTINLLPSAMRGDRVNRTFYVKEVDGEIEVDYFVYLGNTTLSDNCFLTIKDHESFDPSDYEVNDFDEIDFYAIGWDDKISEEIDHKINELEEQAAHETWQDEMKSRS